MELKALTLKVRKDIWFAWKTQAAAEGTTMSELAERLVWDHVTKVKQKRARFSLTKLIDDPEEMQKYIEASRPKAQTGGR